MILANPNNILIEDVRNYIVRSLIDGEYFYAEKWKLPLLFFETRNEADHDWHEFISIEATEEKSNMTIDAFLKAISA